MTTPTPQDYAPKEWRGLTQEERAQAVSDLTDYGVDFVAPLFAVIERVEAILREKNAAPQSGWISVDERLPPCDGETMFIGENEAGYVACFNRFTEDGYCFHDSAESEICVMSGLRMWKRVDLPPPPSTKGESTNG